MAARPGVLRAEQLACFRAERLVFHDLSFTVAPGAALLLEGPNGSGKSSLLRVLAGLLPPAAGTLTWDGEDALADLGAHARRLAWLGHREAIKPALSTRGNLWPHEAGAAAALAGVGLEALADLPARLLSAGQLRRLALARVVAAGAALWLLDEPTLGLDAASVERLGGLVAAHCGAGGMVIAATHLALPFPGAERLRLDG